MKLELRKRVSGDLIGGWSTVHTQKMEKMSEDIAYYLACGKSQDDAEFIKRISSRLNQWAVVIVSGGWSTQNLSFFQEQSTMILAETQKKY